MWNGDSTECCRLTMPARTTSIRCCRASVCWPFASGYRGDMTSIGVRALAIVVAAQLLTGCVVAAGSSNNDSGSSFFFLLVPFALVLVMAGLARRRLGPARGRRGRFSEHDDTTNE